MKYVRFSCENTRGWGVLEDDRIHALAVPPYEELQYTGQYLPLSGCRLLPPCRPTKIVCVGKNYYDHAVEMGEGVPETPILFLKGPNTLNRPEGTVTAPEFVTRVDYEGELGVVIRRRAKGIRAEDASEYILGYTCVNDVTARIIQKADGQWTRGKSMDGFCPCGPWVESDLDPADLTITTRLNGKVVQQSRTGLLMHPVGELLAFITASMTLEPGDLIATGTPEGIGPMGDGDLIEVDIQGIGVLANRVSLPQLKNT